MSAGLAAIAQPAPAQPLLHLPTELAACVLRPWALADKADLVRHANCRKVWRNLTHLFPHPYTEAHADDWFQIAAQPGRSLHLAITLDGAAVGGIGAISGEGVHAATAQFGYWLGEAVWGRGLATAAARAMVAHIEAHQLFARLEASVYAWNPASMRVLEKAGFHLECHRPRSVSKDGQLIDSAMYVYLSDT